MFTDEQVLKVTAPPQYTDEKGIPIPPESVTDLLSYPDEHKGKWLDALEAEIKGLDEQGVWQHNVTKAADIERSSRPRTPRPRRVPPLTNKVIVSMDGRFLPRTEAC